MYSDDHDAEWRVAYQAWLDSPDGEDPEGEPILMCAFRAGMLYERSARVHGPWTSADSYVVYNEYATTPTKVLAKKLNRTEASINARARRLGLVKDPKYLAEMPIRTGIQKPKE